MPTKDEYRKDPEKHKTYNRAYLKKWRAENPDKKPHTQEWYRKYMREDYRKRPFADLKLKARQKVYEAIHAGKLTRGVCESKGCSKLGEGHHSDYSKPLDVNWLCKTHHTELHNNI